MKFFKKYPKELIEVASEILACYHLHYIKDIRSKTATGVTFRYPESVYRERRAFKLFITLQILALSYQVKRRPYVASHKR